jgi:hypothetical protein
MLDHLAGSRLWAIITLVVCLSCNSMVFEACKHPDFRLVYIGADVFQRKIISNIPVKLTIVRITGIPFHTRPHEIGKLEIPGEGMHTVWTSDGSIISPLHRLA